MKVIIFLLLLCVFIFPVSCFQPITIYEDADGDGYGNPDVFIESNTNLDGYVNNNTDCNDKNVEINPDALEICGDGMDNNCDAAVDCDDSLCESNPLCTIICLEKEIPGNGIDDDCNGFIDEKITLMVHSDGWGDLLEVLEMEEEGDITITVDEEYPYYGDTPQYFIYVSRDGYFTEYHYSAYGETITVDLDPIDTRKYNGTIYIRQRYFGPTYLSDTQVSVYNPDGDFVMDFTTDSQGRFSIDIPQGNYNISFIFNDHFGSIEYLESFEVAAQYDDYEIYALVQAAKPNIYLYPDTTLDVEVSILFPHGGYVSESIPDYGSGWSITVEPSGLIDSQYNYLFYESIQPDLSQYSEGWVVPADGLETFFRQNMELTGFNEKEIEDFIEYWIPRLTGYSFYAIYPQYTQDVDKMILLNFSVEPDSILRVIYTIKGLDNDNVNITQPMIPAFSRDNFTVVEWGVILK